MRNLTLLFTLLLTTYIGHSQCPVLITITTQQQIDDFALNYPDCTGVGLTLTINGQNSDIINLSGLSQLTSLTRFEIFNTDITDFSGFDNVLNIQTSFRILDNDGLVNLGGLETLQSIGQLLQIAQNSALVTLQGLSGLEEVGGNFFIETNSGLQSLLGINNLTSVLGNFEIKNNSQLTDLQALNSLETVGSISQDRFYLFNNSQLRDLDGLGNLRTIFGSLEIRNNGVLNSLGAIANLESVSTLVSVRNNPVLSDCSVTFICDNLSNPDLEFIFENNAPNCNSIQEVTDNCLLSISDINVSNGITVYPNPVPDILQIQTSKSITLQNIQVYTPFGASVISTAEKNMDLSNLASGIYFLRITTNQGSTTRKIVKE